MKITKLEKLLEGFNHSKITLKPNYLLIPVTVLKPTVKNVNLFNSIWEECKKLENKLIRTKSGGISKKKLRLPAWSIEHANYSGELVIMIYSGCYRIQLRNLKSATDDDKDRISGHKAYLAFKNHLKKYNINLDDYAIPNGEEINSQTERYIIDVESKNMISNGHDLKIWRGVHHLDFHSSFPAGLVNTHPEFKDAINDLYIKRKENPVCKAILNFAIGYLHSKFINYKFSQLSKDAINDNNRRIREMRKKLVNSGRIPILYNTDGIWYIGREYHGPGEGKNLGDWENDHVNCKLRVKSKGAYEFIENGQYYPVVRGRTTLDEVKNRSEWEWGDIYKGKLIKFFFTNHGIIYKEFDEDFDDETLEELIEGIEE